MRRKSSWPYVVLVICLSLCSAVAAMYHFRLVGKSLQQETKYSLMEVTTQSSLSVSHKMAGDLQFVEVLANAIGSITDSFEKTLPLLRYEGEQLGFKRMGIITKDGTSITTDGAALQLQDRDFFIKAMQGESTISDVLYDRHDFMSIYVYAAPIYRGREVEAVLFGTFDAQTYRNLITYSAHSFGGESTSFLINESGQVMLQQQKGNQMVNLWDAVDQDEREAVQKSLHSHTNGTFMYTINGVRMFASFAPLRVNKWLLVSAVPVSFVKLQTKTIMDAFLLFYVAIVIAFTALFSFSVYRHKKHKEKLEALAYFDPVTNLMNFDRFTLQAKKTMEKGGKWTIVSMDIASFKLINDQFGFSTGNDVLYSVANITKIWLQKHESSARFIADTFIMLLEYKDAMVLEQRLRLLKELIALRCEETNVAVQFGIYLVNEESVTMNLMADRAILAMQAIKQNHNRYYAYYEESMRQDILRENEIAKEMKQALVNKEFVVYYQPKYHLNTKRIGSGEALVRWMRHGELMPPMSFIPLFERNGFIIHLDYYVLEEVCRLLRHRRDDGLWHCPLAVNISRVTFAAKDFVTQVLRIVNQYGIPHECIELELTETALDGDLESVQKTFTALKKNGFMLSIDDFGSGYSSLKLLKDIPADVLKLDQNFFRKAQSAGRNRVVIENIIAMAKKLQMQVVAEGVELTEQVAFLESVGCEMVQGYAFSRPLTSTAFEELLTKEECGVM